MGSSSYIDVLLSYIHDVIALQRGAAVRTWVSTLCVPPLQKDNTDTRAREMKGQASRWKFADFYPHTDATYWRIGIRVIHTAPVSARADMAVGGQGEEQMNAWLQLPTYQPHSGAGAGCLAGRSYNWRIESDRGTADAATEVGPIIAKDAPSWSRRRRDITVVEPVAFDMVVVVRVVVGTHQWIHL